MATTDSFTGTDGLELTAYSANWSMAFGPASRWLISGNKLALQGGVVDEAAAIYAGSFPADQYAQIAVTTATFTDSFVGALVRGTPSTYYGYYHQAGAQGTDLGQLFKVVNGGWTQLGSDSAQHALSDGDTLRLAVAGTTLTPTMNGSTASTPGAQTDSEILTGNPGIAGYSATVTANPLIDNFEASDPHAVSTAPKRAMLMGFG